MCFSATASFGASAFLIGVGVTAIKRIESRKMLPLASVPILFGIQQFSEGMLWLSFSNPELVSWRTTSIYGFLLIAQVAWPAWVPWAVWLAEPDSFKKKLIFGCLLAGLALSVAMVYYLFAYDVSAEALESHIRYHFYFPSLGLRRLLYFVGTLVPLFISSLRWMKLLGAAFFGSLILSFIFFSQYVISVW